MPIFIWQYPAVATPQSARSYLESFLRDLGVELKDASERIGRNHAYLHQYVRGKPSPRPLWLPEDTRDALVRLYGMDASQLRRPPSPSAKGAMGDRQHKGKVHPPGYGKFVDDPSKLELLDIWDIIDESRRPLAMDILRRLAREASPIAA